MRLTRRNILRAGASALVAPALTAFAPGGRALAQTSDDWRHALSLFGDVKYPQGFKNFEYVNPAAPKGGVVRTTAIGTFDNFNMVIGGVRGSLAAGVTLIFDSLMEGAQDEISTEYGLLAEAVRHPADFASATYRLRAIAKWHDGKPVTIDDVIFSLEMFKKHHPQYAAYYRHVIKAEQTGERDVTFTFDAPGNRELPQIMGQLNILPKHWWEGTDEAGRKRDISLTTTEAPLGNGAYRVKTFSPGRSIVYERVPDYWGKDLPINIGRNNFDELRFEYFRETTVALEAFKRGEIDFRTESSAKNWATEYVFAAVQEKRVVLDEFPVRSMGIMQAFVPNGRREKFADPRVRRALNFAFDFEEMNKQIFFGQYSRVGSYFEGTELASSGLPQGRELEILDGVRAQVPADLFTKPYANPVGGSAENVRNNLREATRLLREAGYEVRNQKLVNAKTSEPMTIELLVADPAMERVVLFYKPSLERLGITVTARTVDSIQYENRLRSWDYDIIVSSWPQSLSPGNEQRHYWGSAEADTAGSRNFAGIKNPAIDALIERVIFATSRPDLEAATRALDRVLLWNHYVVPQWTYSKTRTARWDLYGKPETLPKYGMSGFPQVWWWDEAKAAKTRSRT